MTRFTETDKWRDKWFLEREPIQKILFMYLCDNCNNAGFIEINFSFWSLSIGCSKTEIEGAWKGLGRGLVVSGDWAFVRTYLKHQKHLPLNEVNLAHRQIIRLMKEQESRFPDVLDKSLNGIVIEGACKGLPSPTGIGKGIGKGIGEGKVERPRNLLMDALSKCDGGPEGLTKSAWSRVAKALSEIKSASPDVTPEEIDRRAANYRTHYPECACTSTALSKHWATCKEHKAQNQQTVKTEPKPIDWDAVARKQDE